MTKTKQIVLFDPGSIELTITGAIKKNTLPAVRGEWSKWLESFDAATLETDADFANAAKFVTECKRVEERLAGIREDALKGKVFEAIKELEAMGETTRQKRLEFDRAVTKRKGDLKAGAISKALEKCRTAIAPLKYRDDALDVEAELREAIKGLSAVLKMQEALDGACELMINTARGYSDTREDIRAEVAQAYAAAGETATDTELCMIVRTYGEGALERAKFILDQKKIARDQMELDRKNREAEAAKEPAPAAPPVQAAPPAPGAVWQTLRFGATFDTQDTAHTVALIESVGGKNVVFKEMPKENK